MTMQPRSTTNYPMIIPASAKGENAPSPGPEYHGQLRRFEGVPGYSDGVYLCTTNARNDWGWWQIPERDLELLTLHVSQKSRFEGDVLLEGSTLATVLSANRGLNVTSGADFSAYNSAGQRTAAIDGESGNLEAKLATVAGLTSNGALVTTSGSTISMRNKAGAQTIQLAGESGALSATGAIASDASLTAGNNVVAANNISAGNNASIGNTLSAVNNVLAGNIVRGINGLFHGDNQVFQSPVKVFVTTSSNSVSVGTSNVTDGTWVLTINLGEGKWLVRAIGLVSGAALSGSTTNLVVRQSSTNDNGTTKSVTASYPLVMAHLQQTDKTGQFDLSLRVWSSSSVSINSAALLAIATRTT